MKYIRITFFLFVIFTFIGCVTTKKIVIEPYRIIYTTGLDSTNRPINDLKQVSFADERVYIFVYWNISADKHSYLCKIYDSEDREVFRNIMEFTPPQNSWNTWTWYNFNTNIDQPGLWRFEIYIDGVKYIDELFPIS